MSDTQIQVTVAQSGAPYAQLLTVGRHVLTADEPPSRGGQDAGPSPYDYLLAGLGACTLITMRMYAERHKWLLDEAKVGLWHEKLPATDGAPATDRFHRVIHLGGSLSEEQRSRLLQIAEHCPVSETLRRSATVETMLASLSPKAA
jgi:putative redox protein